MAAIVCTLFEGNYVKGCGVLLNSLYRNGFRGRTIVGYRGALPAWIITDKAGVMEWATGLDVEFRYLHTAAHFTNYKAEFMLQLFEDAAIDAVFYMDPDIVVTQPWSYFEQWVQAGVAVCEDINSPVPVGNPRRFGWRETLTPAGIGLTDRMSEYANGGFVGIQRCHLEFLHKWQEIQNIVSAELGGSDRVVIGGGVELSQLANGFAHCWSTTDQDALNATIEACASVPVSFAKRSMMGFEHGFCGLPHALGRFKPWSSSYIFNACLGYGPGRAHRAFWLYADGPRKIYSPILIYIKKVGLAISAFISRFYGRL